MERNPRIYAPLVLILLAAFAFLSISSDAATAKDVKPRTSTIMGRLEQSNTGFVIKRGKTTYGVTGQDFSQFVGKKVKVRGTVSKGNKGPVMEVTKIEEYKKGK